MTRGRKATRPHDIPLKGWLNIGKRIWSRQASANLGLLAAGIAFYGLLSLFPGITAAVAIAGALFDPNILMDNSQTFAALLPESARDIVLGQLREVLGSDNRALGYAAMLTLGIALYSASKATGNFIIGLNVVYDEDETRGFFALFLRNIVLTVGLIFGLFLAVIIVAALPAIAAWFGQTLLQDIVMLARWPVLLLIAAAGITLLFRFGPDRRPAKWRWLTPGAGISCILWVAGSAGFSFYVQSFGTYNETFGALGGVIVLLTWLWLSAFIVLLGALLDAEIEAQTARDSTIGEERPLGQRGAVKADTLGPLRGAETPAE